MDSVNYKAHIISYLSEITINSKSTILDYSIYLELILNKNFAIYEKDGILELYQIKARVDKYRGLTFTINPNEHPPPHFHVHADKVNASFTIDDCSLIAGEIQSGDLRKIHYWHSKAKAKLIEVWNSTRPTNCVVGKYREKQNK
ncbi:MAG: DUF4160 domain-containing protein [Candidatus Hodarchaeales archaeon]